MPGALTFVPAAAPATLPPMPQRGLGYTTPAQYLMWGRLALLLVSRADVDRAVELVI